jgi:aspartyl-tRNA synthetase
MYRTHTCDELRLVNKGEIVTLAGWVQRIRDKGKMLWIDLRDRYGITQLIFEQGKTNEEIFNIAKELGREYVIQVSGEVIERYSKNPDLPTGEIEIFVTQIKILSKSEIPPFTIENNTDGGEEVRYKYRYLDLRRPVLQKNIQLRYRVAKEVRNYFDKHGFLEIETPYLIKSTPEGARDFIVPSRLHPGNFYALPQSPQTFKQLLMVAGYDRYFQIVKCFRDEDFRADRQPEFTQIDCEMAFVEQEDVLEMFEGMMKHLLKEVLGIEIDKFPRLTYDYAMEKYGSDKPDIRFEMLINDLTDIIKGKGFKVFDDSEYIGGLVVKNQAGVSRKVLDKFTNFVKQPQIGAKGLVYAKYNQDGTIKSSIDKFYSNEDWKAIFAKMDDKAKPGDLVLILSGNKQETLVQLGKLRLHVAEYFDLIDHNKFAPLWVINFPLFEWDEEENRFVAMHHPFTSPVPEDIHLFDSDPGKMKANAYDMVLNGVEVGGGSIRIHDSEIQRKMFRALNLSEEEIEEKFGFIINAFKYGAPPHGGIAFGLDRIVALFARTNSIRDVIAFPKNNAGKDVMLDSPSPVSPQQLEELHLEIKKSDN